MLAAPVFARTILSASFGVILPICVIRFACRLMASSD